MIVRLTEEQMRFVVGKTRDEYPFEACGLLFGHIEHGVAAVEKIVASNNLLKSSTRFQIDPEEFLGALNEAESENLDHVGFFHSHPASPEPSMTDIEHMQLWPDSIWLILSSTSHDMAAYYAVNSSFRRITLDVSDQRQ